MILMIPFDGGFRRQGQAILPYDVPTAVLPPRFPSRCGPGVDRYRVCSLISGVFPHFVPVLLTGLGSLYVLIAYLRRCALERAVRG